VAASQTVNSAIKISSSATSEFWEIPVLFEDAHLLALDKPAGLLASPDSLSPDRPSLVQLLHDAIAVGKPWAVQRGVTFLGLANRLDPETSGVLLLARSKAVLDELANLFGGEKPQRQFVVLAHGSPAEDRFQVNAKLAPHPVMAGAMRVDAWNGKRAETRFTVLERFTHQALLRCEPLTDRPHQIRVHLCNTGLRVVGDKLYGGKPLWLSRLKKNFRLKPGREERPLISRVALHAEQLTLPHPVTGEPVNITSPWPKDFLVALKYLRQFSAARA
jgi:23S rRNA pseudouridine1911/1915/1917 synthase